jgi:uncharacterized protein (DUF362 family)
MEAGAALGILATSAHCSPGSPAGPRVDVGVASATDVEAAVRAAVELAGGLGDIGPGKTVFIKPNGVYAVARPGVTTSPAVIQAVVKLVKERNPKRIVVGEHSARGVPTSNALNVSGIAAAAMAGGADEIYAAPAPLDSPADWQLLQPPHFEETWAPAGGILALKRIIESDVLVSVPVLKNHRWALYSMGMKIFIGAIGDMSRTLLHFNLGSDPAPLGRDIAIINQMFHPVITILDGWNALINGGPDGGVVDAVSTAPHVIIAGRDRLAVDAVGVSYLKLEAGRTTIPMPDQAQATLNQPGGPWSLPSWSRAP